MSFRSVPTVQDVLQDALSKLSEKDKGAIWGISIDNGRVSIPQLNMEFDQEDIHEVHYLDATEEESVPGRNSLGGLPLYFGKAYFKTNGFCLILRSDLQKLNLISCYYSLECELDGRRWVVPLRDKELRRRRSNEIWETFVTLRPIVRRIRVSREIDKINRGEVLDLGPIAFHRQKVDFKIPKEGFFNSITGRKEIRSCAYSDVSVRNEGAEEYAPQKVVVSFYGYPKNDQIYSAETKDDCGNQFMIKPIVEHMKGIIRNSSFTVSKKDNSARLKELRELLDQGLLTTAEHDTKRSEIINEI